MCLSQGRSAGTGVFCDELFGVRSQGLLGDDSVAECGQNILYISSQITWYLFKKFKNLLRYRTGGKCHCLKLKRMLSTGEGESCL